MVDIEVGGTGVSLGRRSSRNSGIAFRRHGIVEVGSDTEMIRSVLLWWVVFVH